WSCGIAGTTVTGMSSASTPRKKSANRAPSYARFSLGNNQSRRSSFDERWIRGYNSSKRSPTRSGNAAGGRTSTMRAPAWPIAAIIKPHRKSQLGQCLCPRSREFQPPPGEDVECHLEVVEVARHRADDIQVGVRERPGRRRQASPLWHDTPTRLVAAGAAPV